MEAKEAVVGFALVEAKSREEAIEFSRRFWQVAGDITPGIHNIVAYMISDDGLLQAISNEVTLSVAGP